MRACVLVVCVLAACSGRAHEVPSWQASAGSRRPTAGVTLPDTLPQTEGTQLALRTEVILEPALRGGPLTLVVPCFHGALQVLADGVEIADDGLLAVGEHRYVVPATLTSGERLELVLVPGPAWDGTPAMLVAPYIEAGVARRPSVGAQLNLYAGLAALGVDAFLGGLFGVIYLLDRRRREHAAFSAMTAALVPVCLGQLGLLWPILGSSTPAAVGVSVMLFFVAGAHFVAHTFGRRMPRGLDVLYVVTAIVNIRDPLGGRATMVLFPAATLVAYGYGVWQLVRIAQAGTRRADAVLMLIGWVLASALAILDMIERSAGVRFGGIHLTAPSVVAFVLAHALVLAHQQVARRRELEHSAAELRRQIAARSRELSEALAQLTLRAPNLDSGRLVDGRYRVVRARGSGGFGTVWEVERIADGRRLALKTARGRVDGRALARFAREAELAATTSHPHVLPVLDVGIADGTMFLVMPLVEGGSLEQARGRFGDIAWAKPLLAQVAGGLAHLHAAGIIHRDLKPANILLASDGARIADFGLAALRTGDLLADSTLDATPALTRADEVFGTPRYMAPELATGAAAATAAADVYAFGVIALDLLTGAMPDEAPAAIRRLSGQVREIVEQCLDPDPAVRPTTAMLARSLA